MKSLKKISLGAALIAGLSSYIPTSHAQEQVQIDFWTTNSNEYAEEIAAFEDENPNIDVVTAYQGGYDEMFQQIQSAIVSDSFPNVAQVGERFSIPTIADTGVLVYMDELLDQEVIDDVIPAFWEKFTYKNQKVVAPFLNSTPIMYYNADLFESENVEVPETYEELVEVAKSLTLDEDNDGNIDVWGFTMDDAIPSYYKSMILNQGGNFFNEDGSSNINSEESLNALNYIKDLVHTHKVMPANQYATAYEDFASGNSAILFASGASLGNILNQIGDDFELKTAYLPSIDGESNVLIGGNALAVFQQSEEELEASKQLVQFLISAEETAKFSMDTGYIPVRQSAVVLEEFQSFLTNNENFAVSIDQMENIYGQPINPTDTVLWQGIFDAVDQISDDENADPQQVLDALKETVDNFISNYNG